jgi:predicted outer membrane repeat protein
MFSGNAVNCTFRDNKANGNGGAMSGNGQKATNCDFINNTAKNGGATYRIIANNCTFIENNAAEYGGAMYEGTNIECIFKDNKAGISGDDTYNTTHHKKTTKITADAVTTTYNVNKNLIVTLKDGDGNALSGVNVTVNINGDRTYTTDKNGQIKVNVANFVPKIYTAKITFAGNSNYAAYFANAKVTVKKAKADITTKKKTFKKSKKVKKYSITLKSGKTPIKNAKVTIKIKKTFKATTNAKGKATFKIKKLTKKGTFKATITYKGNAYYNKVTKTVKIKIK